MQAGGPAIIRRAGSKARRRLALLNRSRAGLQSGNGSPVAIAPTARAVDKTAPGRPRRRSPLPTPEWFWFSRDRSPALTECFDAFANGKPASPSPGCARRRGRRIRHAAPGAAARHRHGRVHRPELAALRAASIDRGPPVAGLCPDDACAPCHVPCRPGRPARAP